MFVSGPGFLQPFGGQLFGFPSYAVTGDEPSGFMPCHYVRQPQRSRRQPQPQYHPRYTSAYPWPTPGRHYHQPDVVYDYASDTDDSAEDDEENCAHYPPQTPVRPVQPAHVSHPSTASSSSRSMAHAGLRQAPAKTAARQASPFAPHPHLARPQPHYEQPYSWQQQVRQPVESLQAAWQQAATPTQAQAAAAPPTLAPCTHRQKGARHIPVSGSPASPAPAPQQHQRQQQQQQVHRAAAGAPPRPSRQLRKAEAATIIQSWWRMRRLARQQPALQALMQASAQLRQVASKFAAYKADVSSSSSSSSSDRGFITHKQYLELNELAMRVLLQLDCTPCGVPELRAVRKRLAASAMGLLDKIQAAFSAAVNASMEVPDSLVEEAVGRTSSKPGHLAATPHQEQQQEEEDGWVEVEEPTAQEQDQQQGEDQQGQQQSPADMDEPAVLTGSEPACQPVASGAAELYEVSADLLQPGSSDRVDVPVRVVLRVAGQCCDTGTQTD